MDIETEHYDLPDHYVYKVSDNREPAEASELTVLFCGEGSPVKLQRTGPGIHDYVLVHTIISGKGVFRWKGSEYELTAGDTFVIFEEDLFEYQADGDDPWTYKWVAFRGYASSQLLSEVGLTPEHPVIAGASGFGALVLYDRLQAVLAGSGSAAVTDMEASGWLRLLLGEFARLQPHRTRPAPHSSAAAKRQVDQAARWLQTHYAEQVSIQELARSLGYHRTHLSKLFRLHTGLSPMQYLQQLRLKKSADLLKTDLTIEQVAGSSGFADPLYFSRQFKSSFGLSPSAYRHKWFGGGNSQKED